MAMARLWAKKLENGDKKWAEVPERSEERRVGKECM